MLVDIRPTIIEVFNITTAIIIKKRSHSVLTTATMTSSGGEYPFWYSARRMYRIRALALVVGGGFSPPTPRSLLVGLEAPSEILSLLGNPSFGILMRIY